ncbi:S8 family serine peptidase [bacterium]|nr:S8 family serine peptidase [bacterium]
MIIKGQEMLRTGYAEKREAAPKVALLDNFENTENSTAHGEMTESVLLGYGQLQDGDVQRYHCGNGNPIPAEAVLQAPAEKLGGTLRAHVALSGALLLKATTENLRQIAAEQPDVKVISQSQSQSPVRVAQPFYEAAAQDPQFRERLGKALGLPPQASLLEVAEQLFITSEKFLRDEDAVKEARAEYLQAERALNERGVIHLLAAGNLGEFSAQLEAKGVQFSPSAFRSVLTSDYSTVVGSLDEQGQLASFTSPRAGTDVLAAGVNLAFSDPTPAPGQTPNEVLYGNGTSLSVPLVAGQVVKLAQANPGWGQFEVEASLQGVKASRLSQGQQGLVELADGSRETMVGDGKVDDFIVKAIGTGFITGLDDDSVPQFVQSEKNFRLVLPGETPEINQVIDVRDNGEGQRKFTLQTAFGSHTHVLKGEYSNGTWNPQRTVEEFYLSPGQK